MTSGTTQRTLTASAAGPVVFGLDMPHGQIRARVCEIDHAEIELSTSAPAESPNGEAIAAASVSCEGQTVRVHVPTPDGTTTVVNHSRGGRTVVVSTNVTGHGIVIAVGNMTISGSGIVGGQIITGTDIAPAVHAEIRLPHGSALRVRTKTGQVSTTGELEWVRFTSQSGDLHGDACRKLTATTTSGDVCVDYADHAEVRTVSGDIRFLRTETVTAASTSGDIALTDFGGAAQLTTTSGDITVHATEPGHIAAASTSGDIAVTAPAELVAATGEDALTVDAHSLTGDVRTPRPVARPTRPRRSRPDR